jgi:putative ABC transport system permease protein
VSSLSPEVRAAIRQVDPLLAMSELLPMKVVRNRSLSQQRVSAVLIGTFALGALLLAAMGLFGVVAAAVTRRRHELAVRLALGADHARLLRLVVGEGMRLVLLGIVIGLPGTWLAGRLVRSILVGTSPSDPLALSAAAAGLVMVTVAACYLPARRVLRIEPSRSMRDDSV